jgi:NAD-dependent SIR2 family protein deacetylase
VITFSTGASTTTGTGAGVSTAFGVETSGTDLDAVFDFFGDLVVVAIYTYL